MKTKNKSAKENIRVLIAEDDFLVNEMIEGISEELGYTIVGRAANGVQAVEMTRTARPDVILMDIKMPELDGIEACRRIQQTCPTPIVVLTAYETPDLVRRSGDAGVGAYITKPPKATELERAVVIAMARFNDMMELRRLNDALKGANQELQKAILQIETLGGLMPVCIACKKIQDEKGVWTPVDVYIHEHSGMKFAEGLCPDCADKKRP